MKLFFILGRNPTLSKEEVFSYLDTRKINFEEIIFEENILLIETSYKEIPNIQDFGGVLKIGKISFEGSPEGFQKFASQEELVPSDKFTYTVLGNFDIEVLKEKFKKERKKAILKHGKEMKMQDETKMNLSTKTDFSIFFYKKDKILFFGLASQDYDFSKVIMRDMEKPNQRASLAISPRLSKILVNLSGAKQENLLLDPFCRVGGILQEALIKNINVYGTDKDEEAIRQAEENLRWLKSNYNVKSSLILETIDSRDCPNKDFDAVATETPLGKVLRKRVPGKEAKKMIQNFESFIIPVLKRLKKIKKEDARIAITFPVIGRFRTSPEKISKSSGLKILKGPISESRKDQFISRDILVFI